MNKNQIRALLIIMMAAPAWGADGDKPAQEASTGLLPIPDYSGDIWTRRALTGDWGGTRQELANKGVQLTLDFTQYAQTIVDGGRREASAYGGHADYLLKLDLMRMGVLPGALVTVRAESRYGHTVNGTAGPVLPVNTAGFFPLRANLDEGVDLALTNFNLTQFLGEHVGVIFGKLDTLDGDPNEFASGRGKSQFMSANFIFNSALALRLPYSTLGAGVIVLPMKGVTISSILMNTTDSSVDTGFNDFGKGYTWTTEADFQYRLGNLPGGMNVGALYSFAQDFTQLSGSFIFPPGGGLALPTKSDTWAAYWSLWQYLYVADPNDNPIVLNDGMADHQGIGLFARAGFADQDTNPVEWSGSFGLSGRGLIPSRSDDTYGIGYYYTRFQETRFTNILGVGDEGQGLEAYYSLAITRAAHLTFDIQWQNTPLPNVDSAVILGMRLNLGF